MTLVENSGAISASGALATFDRNVAVDLAANGAGVTVRQTAVAAGVTAPSIVGEIRFGGGNDVLDVANGTIKGNSRFGTGTNRFALSGDAAYEGATTFGAGADTMVLSGTSTFTGAAEAIRSRSPAPRASRVRSPTRRGSPCPLPGAPSISARAPRSPRSRSARRARSA